MQKIKKTLFLFILSFISICTWYCTTNALPTCAFDTIKPYDTYLWTAPRKTNELQIEIYGANSFHERGVWCDHTKICNVLQLYSCDQNALAMIRGFDPSTEIGQFAAQFSQVPDDGIRGHLVPYAQFHMSEIGLSAQYWFPHYFCLGVYLPILQMSLTDLSWKDLTQNITPADVITKQLLTDNFAYNVCKLGGPIINRSYKCSGIGDIDIVARLQRNFPQAKSILTNTQLGGYLGFSLPTGKRTNEDLLFALPFGYDGSPGVLFGGALGLTWKNHFIGGVQLNLTQLIGNTRPRRIRTDINQTDLVLLAKTPAHINWGFIQRYRLYLGAYQIMRGLSFDVGYQYQKQGESFISLCGNEYISSITNTSEILKEWTLHDIMVNVSYNFGYDTNIESKFSPAITFFYQHAFRGQRALLLDKWGFALELNF